MRSCNQDYGVLINKVDVDGEGTVDYNEFAEVLKAPDMQLSFMPTGESAVIRSHVLPVQIWSRRNRRGQIQEPFCTLLPYQQARRVLKKTRNIFTLLVTSSLTAHTTTRVSGRTPVPVYIRDTRGHDWF